MKDPNKYPVLKARTMDLKTDKILLAGLALLAGFMALALISSVSTQAQDKYRSTSAKFPSN